MFVSIHEFNLSSYIIYLLNIQLVLALNKSNAPSNVHETEIVRSTYHDTSLDSKLVQTINSTDQKYIDLEASILLSQLLSLLGSLLTPYFLFVFVKFSLITNTTS